MRQHAQSSQLSTWDRIQGCTASVDRSISSQRSRRLSCVHSLDPWQRSWSASCILLIWETHLKCRHNMYSETDTNIEPSYTWDTSYWRLCSHRFGSSWSIPDLLLFHLIIKKSRQYYQNSLHFYPCHRLHSKTGSRQIHHKTYNYLPLCQCNRRELPLKYDLDVWPAQHCFRYGCRCIFTRGISGNLKESQKFSLDSYEWS